ncbi:MAG: recombinase family protein [Oscillospiraceae bacterium]|jgi:DNA invertase Pin-like site-specific DNA recombinase|nr:recombinase family protein [Oscillospiraceae bacterium]
MMERKTNVTVIPATIGLHQRIELRDPTAKRRVAAYARVSTDKEEQENSFEAQVDYYTKYINERPDWQLIEVFTDEGISALNTKKREGFNRMISDALNGRLDLIVTKSVSRFARNTVDSLNTIRALKEKNVECFFEKEQIWTFDGKGELLLTIMSSLAQEESRSLSENVTWGQRKRMADGKITMAYKHFLGYEKGKDGKPKIVESEAKVVREIYSMFLNGNTIRQICRTLTERKIPTPSGKENWAVSTVRSILTNERYKGEALLQKKFTVDFLKKKMVKNEGQVPQYYVENSHPAIVSAEVFDMVQAEMAKIKERGRSRSGISCFSDKIICGSCGSIFGSKTWNSTNKYKRRVWQCNGKYAKGADNICRTPHLDDEQLKKVFITAFNKILQKKEFYIEALAPLIAMLEDTSETDVKIQEMTERSLGIYTQMKELVEGNAKYAQDQSEFTSKYNELNQRYESIKEKLAELESEKQSRLLRINNIRNFIETLKTRDKLVENFDESLFSATVEYIKVYTDKDICVTFKDGKEVKI